MKGGKGSTIFPLGHDGVTQRQRCEELSADGTLPAPDLLHQARGRHEEATAGVWVPAQVHGLQRGGKKCTLRRHSYLTIWIQK